MFSDFCDGAERKDLEKFQPHLRKAYNDPLNPWSMFRRDESAGQRTGGIDEAGPLRAIPRTGYQSGVQHVNKRIGLKAGFTFVLMTLSCFCAAMRRQYDEHLDEREHVAFLVEEQLTVVKAAQTVVQGHAARKEEVLHRRAVIDLAAARNKLTDLYKRITVSSSLCSGGVSGV